MARAIATESAVFKAANDIFSEGNEPSVLEVRERVGGGSFSTVKQYLDAWSEHRELAKLAADSTPPEIEAKGREFAHVVWSRAFTQAQNEVDQVRKQAEINVNIIEVKLAEATVEIGRLERIEAEQNKTNRQLKVELRSTELALAESKARADRAGDLEKRLENAVQDAKADAKMLGELNGENLALRAQIKALQATQNSGAS